MNTELTSIFSVIATFFAAVVAWLAWRTQKRYSDNTVRPEVLLEEWKNVYVDGKTEINIGFINNFGNGPALNLRSTMFIVSLDGKIKKPALLFSDPINCLPPGEKQRIDWKIIIWQHDIEKFAKKKLLLFEIIVCFNDLHENYYEQMLSLALVDTVVFGAEELAPGLHLTQRKTSVKSYLRIYCHRIYRKLKKVVEDIRRRCKTPYK